MNFIFKLFVLLLLSAVKAQAQQEVSCESFGTLQSSGRTLKLCKMMETTSINSKNTTMSVKDEEVKAVTFYMNENIFYLPVNISKNFPDLIDYNAANCKIKELFNENFRGLWDLERLSLHHNEIEKINYDTFQRLYNLKYLQLMNNKIKYLNGNVFTHTYGLTYAFFEENECIDINFIGYHEVSNMKEKINEKCGYNETIVEVVC